MAKATAWFRSYADEGRLQKLVWFVLVSGALALAEWSLSPAIGRLWLSGFHISDSAYFSLMFALASMWTLVVGVGLFNCGWPALVMLAYVKWGLFPVYLVAAIYWTCAVRDSCP